MPTEQRLKKIKSVVNNRQEGVIVLEDIFDPHNAEAVFRSCDAYGFQKVYIIFDKQAPFNPKKIGKSSSSSANKWIDFTIFRSTKECLDSLKKDGYKLYATALRDDSKKLSDIKFTESKTALMFGNEGRGLSDEAINMADEKIIIPMTGMVQSLNLSVTAATLMYELTRQRRTLGMDKFLLEKSEQIRLVDDFLER